MDLRQPSFIPKKINVDSAVMPGNSSKYLGLFSIICISCFIVAVILTAAIFIYTYNLNNQLSEKKDILNSFQTVLNEPIINELKAVSAKLETARNRLDAHLSLSEIFLEIENITLKNVRWKNFKLIENESGLVLSMDGEAKTFNSVALQSDELLLSDYFINPVISNLNVAKTDNQSTNRTINPLLNNPTVTFSLKTNINPEKVSFREKINLLIAAKEAELAEQIPTVNASTSTSTTGNSNQASSTIRNNSN